MSEVAISKMNEAMTELYGNPSSLHTYGQIAKEALESARESIASHLGCSSREIYFTSGGSESDNQAIISAALYGKKRGKTHLITTKIEHHAVLHTMQKLEKDGFDVTLASDGRQGVDTFFSIRPDIVLLDIMLPEMDGWEVCREIRKSYKTPIIMLTAKDETADKVTGLQLGADDYISKPFDMKEVIARIHAVLRRYTPCDETSESADIKNFDNLSINMSAYEVLIRGKKVDMPPKELELLNYLASHPNRVFTRNQLLDDVWGFEYFGDSRTVDVHVKRLREKIDGASEQWSLKTVWGVGYKFELNPDK